MSIKEDKKRDSGSQPIIIVVTLIKGGLKNIQDDTAVYQHLNADMSEVIRSRYVFKTLNRRGFQVRMAS